MSGFAYLASPYSSPDHRIRESRFEAATQKAAELMRAGEVIFSPIAHSHPIDLYFRNPESGEFWMRQDIPILRHASKLYVLMLQGWESSKGIAQEVELADAEDGAEALRKAINLRTNSRSDRPREDMPIQFSHVVSLSWA